MQGAPPLAFPGLNPRGTGYFLPCQCFFAPIPPTPFPVERGRPKLFHARGFAPCIPGIKSPTALTVPAVSVSGGGLPSLPPADLAFSLLFCPHPPCPPSQREGGDFLFSYARGGAPCIPGAKPERHWLFLPYQCFPVPIPPTPFPAGRGRPKLFHARGSAPCIPGPGLSPRGTGSIGGAGAPGTPCG